MARVQVMGVTAPSRRKEWIRDLTISCETLNMLLIHTAAKLATRQMGEETVVGGAAAIFSMGGSPWTQSGWTIGSDLTQFDADVAALTKAVEVFSDFYCSDGAPPPPSHLFLPRGVGNFFNCTGSSNFFKGFCRTSPPHLHP